MSDLSWSDFVTVGFIPIAWHDAREMQRRSMHTHYQLANDVFQLGLVKPGQTQKWGAFSMFLEGG